MCKKKSISFIDQINVPALAVILLFSMYEYYYQSGTTLKHNFDAGNTHINESISSPCTGVSMRACMCMHASIYDSERGIEKKNNKQQQQ